MFEFYLNEINSNFEGWDFSHLTNRMVETPLPWGYRSLIVPFILNSNSLLDMGTGGGEFLSELPFPKMTFATEGYQPNIVIATNRLNPLGIKVVEVKDDLKLNFETNYFDLIINRHEEYDTSEVQRILKPNGYFITQQVGKNDNITINQMLNIDQKPSVVNPKPNEDEEWSLGFICNNLKSNGFMIKYKNEFQYPTRVYDIGALIYYVKAIQWQFEDFSLDKYRNELYDLHVKIEEKGFVDVTSERYIVIAKNQN